LDVAVHCVATSSPGPAQALQEAHGATPLALHVEPKTQAAAEVDTQLPPTSA